MGLAKALSYAVLFTIAVFICVLHAEKKEKVLIFGGTPNPFISQTSFFGKGMADIREVVENLSTEFKRLYGYTASLKIPQSPKFLFKAFQDKTVDFGWAPLGFFLYARNRKLPVKPMAAPIF